MIEDLPQAKVLAFYNKHMTPLYYERKNLGQVFTPIELVEKLVDKIPADILSDPTSTYLDPSAGMGGFLFVLYYKLMNALKPSIPSQRTRSRHILENMLFAVEITRNNANRMRKVFGSGLHVHCGDALKTDLRKSFGLEGVRVIVGNPPFEKPQTKGTNKTGGDTLWTSFIHKSFDEWMLPGGVFAMLLPPGWRKPTDIKSRSHGIWERMRTGVLSVDMFNEQESSRWFGGNVAIRFDLVVALNTPSLRKTLIRGTDGKTYKEDVSKRPFLPNANFSYWKRVFADRPSPPRTLSILYSASAYYSNNKNISREKTAAFRFPVAHAIHKDGNLVVLYTNKKDPRGGFGKKKVVMNRLGAWNPPLLDLGGKYGMSQDTFGILVDSNEEGRAIAEFFNNAATRKKWQSDLTWATSKPSVFWKMFRYVKKNAVV